MGRRSLSFLVLALLGAVATFLAVRGWTGAGQAEVRPVPSGQREIAWISPATSSDAWERLVASLELLHKEQASAPAGRPLRIDLTRAFLALSADVPEVSIYYDDAPHARLWVRWYKLTGENPSQLWIDKLIRRGTPPLAIIGGETSDRALLQARALEDVRKRWLGPAPLYFITTATAERYYPRAYQAGDIAHPIWPKLMDVYSGRTFRFCFTNARMAEAVLDFIHQNPQVCPLRHNEPAVLAGIVAQGNSAGALAGLYAAGLVQPFFLATLTWSDDSFSKDLGEIFPQIFAERYLPEGSAATHCYNNYVDYSVGDFLQPNPREAAAVGMLLADNPRLRDQPQLLVLPTGAQRARRFVRTLCRRAPAETRNVVAVSGDAITLNTIYRDRDVAWNIQDMPVSLVFFSHRNPMSAAAGFGQKDAAGQLANTGTQELLLTRDIFETLLPAAFEQGRLVDDADRLLERLRHSHWYKGRIHNDLAAPANALAVPFFDAAGNRQPGTGEHVVWLRPMFEGQRNLPEAVITIWRLAGDDPTRTWRTFSPPLHVRYDRPSREEAHPHGGT